MRIWGSRARALLTGACSGGVVPHSVEPGYTPPRRRRERRRDVPRAGAHRNTLLIRRASPFHNAARRHSGAGGTTGFPSLASTACYRPFR